ncbi:MAG: hypothetical protein GX556_18730 [Fibrobacter sp.]|nr:hypothetical protein [Fibrobacter sp.]
MKKTIILSLMVFFSALEIRSQDDNKPWERLGLSQTEWMLIEEHNISMHKLEQLLKDGIGVGEYIQKPWEKLGMSESKWMAKRRSGLTNYDIELESGAQIGDWKVDNKDGFRSEITEITRHGEAFSSLFLPGYQQLKSGDKVTGRIMVSLAGGAALWCVVGSVANRRFEVIPVVGIIVPDMIWSYIDYKVKDRLKKHQ